MLAGENPPAARVFRLENSPPLMDGCCPAAKASDKRQLLPDFNLAVTYLSGRQFQ
jgi:hypothetical protein